jgi:sugar/nucleoside kinase (ribokinase family)
MPFPGEDGDPLSPRFDVLGLGVVAVDDLIYVDAYPPADSKIQARRRERQCGGLAATALVAASRLGSRCAYAGMLGRDELSRYTRDRFRAEGIDLSHLVEEETARPVHSTIIVDTTGQTRTIFYEHRGSGAAHAELPAADVIRSARVLLVDHWGVEGTIRAGRIARKAGIPVVADFERHDVPRFPELLALANHLILSLDFALLLTGESTPASAARALWGEGRDTVVVTAGDQGCWFLTARDSCTEAASVRTEAIYQPAFPVESKDTTGCGDVFHGAYASALARGLGAVERIRFSSAVAALKATRPGGQAGIPTLQAVEAFLEHCP